MFKEALKNKILIHVYTILQNNTQFKLKNDNLWYNLTAVQTK